MCPELLITLGGSVDGDLKYPTTDYRSMHDLRLDSFCAHPRERSPTMYHGSLVMATSRSDWFQTIEPQHTEIKDSHERHSRGPGITSSSIRGRGTNA